MIDPSLPPVSTLPLKHQRFLVEYLIDSNATQAAIRAGFSKKTASEQGCRLLAKLKPYVEPMGAEKIGKRLMKAVDVVNSLNAIASSDIADFMTWDGAKNEIVIKNPDEIPKEWRQCIASITVTETQHAKYLTIKLHDKVKALGMLAKYHNLFKQTPASRGLMVAYIRPAAERIPEGSRIVDAEVIDPAKKKVPARIEFKRPNGSNGNGHANGHHPENGVQNGHA